MSRVLDIVILLILSTIPAWLDLRARKKKTRMFSIHMAIFAVLITVGFGLTSTQDENSTWHFYRSHLLAAAALLRSGVIPLHGWMMDLFEKASFGTSILFVIPLTGAIVFLRFVLPVAPRGCFSRPLGYRLPQLFIRQVWRAVQEEARRTFAYLFLSNLRSCSLVWSRSRLLE